jgi:hypothetical protein
MQVTPKFLPGFVLLAATALLLCLLWGLWYGTAILAVPASIYFSRQGRGRQR